MRTFLNWSQERGYSDHKDFTGGVFQTFTAPKYELISSHTGRKTFVCLSHSQGIDIETVMKITGMTYPTIKHYLTVEDETTGQAVNDVYKDICYLVLLSNNFITFVQ